MPACLCFMLSIRSYEYIAYSISQENSFAAHFSFDYTTPHGGILQVCHGLFTVDSLIQVLIKHDKIRLASGLKTLTITMKAVDTKTSRCPLSKTQVSKVFANSTRLDEAEKEMF